MMCILQFLPSSSSGSVAPKSTAQMAAVRPAAKEAVLQAREPDSQLGSEPQSRLLSAFCSELHGRAERAAGAYAAMQPVDSIASTSSNFYISFRVNLDFQSFQILF